MTWSGLSAGIALAIGAACGLALILLYLVSRRPVRIVVPFAGPWLWRGHDRAAARRAARLLRVGSLLLHLAMLAAIVTAATLLLADGRRALAGAHLGRQAPPPAGGGPHTGRTIALLLDRSASMQAREQGPDRTRMMRARQHAADLIAAMGPDDRAVVVAFAADAVARTGVESDRVHLAAAVAAIEASDEPGNLPAALDFTAALLRGHAQPTLILIGDGGGADVTDAGTLSALGGVDVRFVPVGQRARNVAIVAFSARRQPGDPSSADLSLVVHSFEDAAADVDVAVTAGPQHIPVARRRLRVGAHARVVADFAGVAVPDARLEAQLENTGDALALDDRAFAVVPDAGRLNVIVIGAPDLYLDGALLSLGAAVAVQRVAPAGLDGSRARWTGADVVIFHGVTPDSAPAPPAPAAAPTPTTTGRFLYLDPDPASPGSPWRAADGIARDPIVSDVVREHPLVRGLSLTDLNIAAARHLVPNPGETVVVRAGRVPLLIARERRRARVVALAFDPRRSDLPMRSAFPLFLANALTWLAERPEAEALSWPTGRTVQVGATRVTLERVGFYTDERAQDHAGARASARAPASMAAVVAANLASPEESDLTPRPQMRIGARTPPPPDSPPLPGRRRPRPETVALLLALGLCAVEWVTYHRRITV